MSDIEEINNGKLATEMGLEKIAKKDLLTTPKEGGQFLDDIFGWKNANGAYVPFSDIYGAVQAKLRGKQQHANIKRKFLTAALIKLGVLTRGRKKGGVVIDSTKLDEHGCLVGNLMVPQKFMTPDLYHDAFATNGIYRRFKNNYGFNGLEYKKLEKVVDDAVAILVRLNNALEEVYVDEIKDKKAAKARGDDPRMINCSLLIKETIAEHLCA